MFLTYDAELLNEAKYRTIQLANTAIFKELKPVERKLLKTWGYKNTGLKNVINSHLFLTTYIRYNSLSPARVCLKRATFDDIVKPSQKLKNDIVKNQELEKTQELINYIVYFIDLERSSDLEIKITDTTENLLILIDDLASQKLYDATDEIIKKQLYKLPLLVDWRQEKLNAEIEQENRANFKSNIELLDDEGYYLESDIDLNADLNTLKHSLKELVLKKSHHDLKDDYKSFLECNLLSFSLIYNADIPDIKNISISLSNLLVDNLSNDWQTDIKYKNLSSILSNFLIDKGFTEVFSYGMTRDLLTHTAQMERIHGLNKFEKLTGLKTA